MLMNTQLPAETILLYLRVNSFMTCKNLTSVTQIYREGNQCSYSLANEGLCFAGLTIWIEIPPFILQNFVKDKLGMPNFRYTTF